MKRHSVIRRCGLTAGLCLLLFGVLAVSLWWATAASSLPVAALQTRAGGDVASPAAPTLPGGSTSGRAAQPVRADAGRATQDISAKAAPPQPDAGRAVHDAWQRARDAGVYNFATDLAQITYPARSLANAGRGPGRADLHMEGEIDQPAAHPGRSACGSPAMAGTGEAGGAKTPGSERRGAHRGRSRLRAPGRRRVERGRGLQRQLRARQRPPGLPRRHEERARDAGGGARGGGAGEQRSDCPSRFTFHVSRFDLDGPTFATYLRDRLEQPVDANGASCRSA